MAMTGKQLLKRLSAMTEEELKREVWVTAEHMSSTDTGSDLPIDVHEPANRVAISEVRIVIFAC